MIKIKCLVLCAGYATRLYPLTENQPKPLLSIGDKTILDHIINKVEQVQEIDEIYIITNDRFASNFQSWLSTSNPKKPTHIINNGTKSNEERLGAVGDMHFALKNKNINEDVLLIAGDNLFEFSLNNFIKFFKEKQSSSIALFNIKDKSKVAKRLGVAITDNESKITDFEEKPDKPKSTLAATCCYALKKESINKLPNFIKEGKADNPGDFIEWLRKEEAIYGFTFSEQWFDIGSFEALEAANKVYSKVDT